MEQQISWESMLFVPGTKPELVQKALRSGAGVVVLDLEDAVAATDKVAARATVGPTLADLPPEAAARVLVRVNDTASPWHEDDVRAAATSRAGGIVLPKYERAQELLALRELASAHRTSGLLVAVGLESARGVLDCRALLAERPDAAYFGAEDLIADVGGRRTPESREVLFGRSLVALAGHVEGVALLDQAFTDVRDPDGFAGDAAAGRDLGYEGKICIHPTQVDLCRAVFSPTAAELSHAQRVLDATVDGVGTVDGQMVDEVHLKQARRILARHRAEPTGNQPDSRGPA